MLLTADALVGEEGSDVVVGDCGGLTRHGLRLEPMLQQPPPFRPKLIGGETAADEEDTPGLTDVGGTRGYTEMFSIIGKASYKNCLNLSGSL